jgi:hypothetical protein
MYGRLCIVSNLIFMTFLLSDGVYASTFLRKSQRSPTSVLRGEGDGQARAPHPSR